MPIYQYRCENCSKEFEKLFLTISQSDAEKDLVNCPECNFSAKREVAVPSPAVIEGYSEKNGYS